jgi:hypothetical protein
MNSRLEQFVRDHREEFDTEEPDAKVWDAIQQDMKFVDPTKKKLAPVVRFYRTRWSVAAAVLLLIAGTTWYFSTRQTGNNLPAVAAGNTTPATQQPTQPSTRSTSPAPTNRDAHDGVQPADSSKAPDVHSLATTSPNDNKAADNNSPEMNSEMKEEMYHYAKIVEIKHKELKTIEKDEPLLYRQFSSDVSKLDSVYHGLQHQLPNNSNREQILEAMIQNLQLQMELLNHQLDIIKQINHSKKTAYDKAYKNA